MAMISVFADTFTSIPMYELQVSAVLENIKNGEYKEDIDHLRRMRKEKGDRLYKIAKRNLKAVTFSGKFSCRKNDDPSFCHSKILLADIDGVGDQLQDLRRKIESDPHTAFCFLSPSGDGLKVGVFFSQKPSGDEEHKRCFSLVEKYFYDTFSVRVDRSCKDIARLCYVSYDPDLFRNTKATPFDIPHPPEPKAPQVPISIKKPHRIHGSIGEEYAKGILGHACRVIATSIPGEKHNTRLRMSRLIGGYVAGGMIREDDAYDLLTGAVIQSGTPERDLAAAFKTIQNGLDYGKAYPITEEQLEEERREYLSRFHNGNNGNNGNNSDFYADEKKYALPSDIKIYLDSLYYSKDNANAENTQFSGNNETEFGGNKDAKKMREILKNTKLPENIEKLIDAWASNNSNNREQRSNNLVTTTVTTAQVTNITSNVNDFILDAVGWFQARDVYDALGARTTSEKGAIRKALHKFTNDGLIERHQTKNGGYRRIDKEAPLMDFMSCKTEDCSDFILPLGIHNMVSIMPGNIVMIAGSPNSGKTSLLLNIAKDNMKKYKVYYWNSEMDEAELRLRMEKFPIPLSEWRDAGFEPRIKHGNFQDVIKPGVGVINIIDFLEIHDEFYAVGGLIRSIHEKLKGAIAVIALQKDKGRDLGRGGMFTIEKPRLALAVDYHPEKRFGTVKIVKAKNFKGGINPNGMSMDFNIVDGAKLIERQGWHR